MRKRFVALAAETGLIPARISALSAQPLSPDFPRPVPPTQPRLLALRTGAMSASAAGAQRLRHMAGITARGGQVVFPWAAILALSGTLAFGMHQSVVRGPFKDQPLAEELSVPTARTVPFTTLRVPTEPGARWVILSSVDDQGVKTHLACLTTPERFAADTLELDPADMNRLASDLRCYTQ
jgi:hypothetical protein